MRSRRLAALVHGCFAVGHRAVGRHWLLGRLSAEDVDMKSRVHPKYKTRYHVANWSEYDRALVQRGDVTPGLSAGAIHARTPAAPPRPLSHSAPAQPGLAPNLVPSQTAAAPISNAAASPRPSAMPPAATTGMSPARSSTAKTTDRVPRCPVWPPASLPSAAVMSAPPPAGPVVPRDEPGAPPLPEAGADHSHPPRDVHQTEEHDRPVEKMGAAH